MANPHSNGTYDGVQIRTSDINAAIDSLFQLPKSGTLDQVYRFRLTAISRRYTVPKFRLDEEKESRGPVALTVFVTGGAAE